LNGNCTNRFARSFKSIGTGKEGYKQAKYKK
jgi:hypothetical protein